MEFFFYGRDRPDLGNLRWDLTEEHWAFMDGYADGMIARGPTLTPDGEGATGSVHIVDLPDAAAAAEFAFEEPYYRGGVFEEVLVRRWHNTLGRTMWDFTGGTDGHRRFLILGHGRREGAAVRSLAEEHHRYLAEACPGGLIALGPLLPEDEAEWLGSAALLELPGRDAAEALVRQGPYARQGRYERVEIHDWRFGGRPAEA